MTLWSIAGRPSGERLIGEADVVHGTNFWIPPLKRRNGVVTIHDLTFWLYPEFCTTAVRRYRVSVPRILRRSTLVITPSRTVAAEISAELRVREDRIVVTPEGIRGVFAGGRRDRELERELGIDRDFVLFAGTQEPRKNLDRLIQSLQWIDDLDFQLVIAGPPGWGSVDLPAVVHKLRLDGRVLFPGYLEEEKLASLMAGATAFAYPSIYEGFGLPPLEAMAGGVPVVAGKAGALPEVLGEAALWCDPQSVESIAEALRVVLTDEHERRRLISEGRRQAARFDWAETARLTLGAYERIARPA